MQDAGNQAAHIAQDAGDAITKCAQDVGAGIADGVQQFGKGIADGLKPAPGDQTDQVRVGQEISRRVTP